MQNNTFLFWPLHNNADRVDSTQLCFQIQNHGLKMIFDSVHGGWKMHVSSHDRTSLQHVWASRLLFNIDSDRHRFNKYGPKPVVPITLRLFLLCAENVPTACVCGEMLYQFHCFPALLHLPQTKWKGEKWTVVASMSEFRPNKAWQNRLDKLKMATLGKEHYSLHGGRWGIPVRFLNYFTAVRFVSAGEEGRRRGEG